MAFSNVYVMSEGKAYRVTFADGTGRVLGVCRKTKHSEVALNIVGRRAAPIIHAATALRDKPSA